MKPTDYKIIAFNEFESVEDSVNAYLKRGYELYGDITEIQGNIVQVLIYREQNFRQKESI